MNPVDQETYIDLPDSSKTGTLERIGTMVEMPGAGFEPAKQYAEELESTPFDHSGTPACKMAV